MPRPTPGPGRSHSESTIATSAEDHLLTATGSSLLLTVWIETRDQVATLSLWVGYCRVSTSNVSLSHHIVLKIHSIDYEITFASCSSDPSFTDARPFIN